MDLGKFGEIWQIWPVDVGDRQQVQQLAQDWAEHDDSQRPAAFTKACKKWIGHAFYGALLHCFATPRTPAASRWLKLDDLFAVVISHLEQLVERTRVELEVRFRTVDGVKAVQLVGIDLL